MGIFKNLQEESNDRPEDKEYNHQAASFLAGMLLKTGKIKHTPDLEKWSDEFRKLREIDETSLHNIQSVLTWYTEHIKDPYVPQAFSATSFRAKFPRLVAAMKRGENGTHLTPISEAATRVAIRLGDLIWPGNEKKDEPQTIQRSLTAHEEFRCLLYQIKDTNDPNDGFSFEYRIAQIVYHKLGDAESFVETWMRSIHNMAWTWAGWRGDLLYFAFRPKQKMFQVTGRGWIAEWCGTPNEWDKMIGRIYEAPTV